MRAHISRFIVVLYTYVRTCVLNNINIYMISCNQFDYLDTIHLYIQHAHGDSTREGIEANADVKKGVASCDT